MKRHFTEEEANAILRKAVERQPMGDEMSREQLQAIALELGITAEALTAAEADWRAEQEASALRATYNAERRASFWERAPRAIGGMVFLVVMGFIMANQTGPSAIGVIILPILALLIIRLTMRGATAYGPATEADFQRWLEGRERPSLPEPTVADTYAAPERRRSRRHGY